MMTVHQRLPCNPPVVNHTIPSLLTYGWLPCERGSMRSAHADLHFCGVSWTHAFGARFSTFRYVDLPHQPWK